MLPQRMSAHGLELASLMKIDVVNDRDEIPPNVDGTKSGKGTCNIKTKLELCQEQIPFQTSKLFELGQGWYAICPVRNIRKLRGMIQCSSEMYY